MVPKQILYVGDLVEGGTCLQRLRALESLGFSLTGLNDHSDVGFVARQCSRISNKLFRLGLPFLGRMDVCNINQQILDKIDQHEFDILWLDKTLTVRPEVFLRFKNRFPKGRIIGYSPDDMCGKHNQSARFLNTLKYYDCYATTKTHNIDQLQALGCRKVFFVDKSFDPKTHRPIELSSKEKTELGGPIGFIGSYEKERADSIRYLAENGIEVKVYCEFWPTENSIDSNIKLIRRTLLGDDYARGICSFDIALCFLRKLNKDRQTARSIEIPACSTFMLAERTAEHQALFVEGKEADYFSTNEELLMKVRFYLENPDKRIEIAAAGRKRCIVDRYSYEARLSSVIESVVGE